MKGAELIKLIAENDAFDKEIVIDFVLKDSEAECPDCEFEYTIETEHEGEIDGVESAYLSDSWKALHLNCVEK